jgi:hypothetical protein
MSDGPGRQVAVPRELLGRARRRGGLCGACGRALGNDEAIYIEKVIVGPGRGGSAWVSHRVAAVAPVGAECVSPAFMQQTGGVEAERCVGCNRPVYYRSVRPNRRRVVCSIRCANRVDATRRAAKRAKD